MSTSIQTSSLAVLFPQRGPAKQICTDVEENMSLDDVVLTLTLTLIPCLFVAPRLVHGDDDAAVKLPSRQQLVHNDNVTSASNTLILMA